MHTLLFMKKWISIAICGFMLAATNSLHADQMDSGPLPLEKALKLDFDVNVKESIVTLNGNRYRKVEYQGELFYLRLLESEKTAGELELECNQGSGQIQMENQVLVSTRIAKRSSLFIDGLRQMCTQVRAGKSKVEMDPNVRIGFVLDDSKENWLKKRSVFITPATRGLGFSGEW